MATKKTTKPSPKDKHQRQLQRAIKPIGKAFNQFPEKVPPINGPADIATVKGYSDQVKEMLAALEEKRKLIIVTLRGVLDILYKDLRTLREPLEAYKEACENELTKYYTAKEEEERKRREREAKKIKKKDPELAEAIEADTSFDFYKDREEKPEGVRVYHRWVHRIVDESKIPREYLMVDDSKLKKYAKLGKDAPEIPGVVFEQIVRSSL